MVKRYGTSSMPVENGIYVLHSDYEALETRQGELREERDDLLKALADCRDAAFDEDINNPHLDSAVGDPLEVPAYVQWELERLRRTSKPTRDIAWWHVALILVPITTFVAGMRYQIARTPAPEPSHIVLECKKDGSIALDMGGAIVGGEYFLKALIRAAEKTCALNIA